MKLIKQILTILLAAIWISISEFVRNDMLVKSIWIEHYNSMGLVFPHSPTNGILWGVWSLFFAIGIYFIAKRFNLIQTTVLSWFIGFVMMWVVGINLGIIPPVILLYAVPLSLLETFIAVLILKRVFPE